MWKKAAAAVAAKNRKDIAAARTVKKKRNCIFLRFNEKRREASPPNSSHLSRIRTNAPLALTPTHSFSTRTHTPIHYEYALTRCIPSSSVFFFYSLIFPSIRDSKGRTGCLDEKVPSASKKEDVKSKKKSLKSVPHPRAPAPLKILLCHS